MLYLVTQLLELGCCEYFFQKMIDSEMGPEKQKMHINKKKKRGGN